LFSEYGEATDRPWVKNYLPGVPADIELPTEPLTALVEDAVAAAGDSAAIEFRGVTTTYAQLGEQISRAAEGLRRLGVQAGDRVAIILPNCPQQVVAFHATLRLGAVVVEQSPALTVPELQRMRADHGAKVAVCWTECADRWEEAGDEGHIVLVDIDDGQTGRFQSADKRNRSTWADLLESGELDPAHVKPQVSDLATIQYTSGTTGFPQGVMLTHFNLYANARQGAATFYGAQPGDVFYAVMPMAHGMGVTLYLTTALLLRARLVVFAKFDADEIIRTWRVLPPASIIAIPRMFARITAAARAQGFALTPVKFAMSGASRLPDFVAEDWELATGSVLPEGYGLTETSPLCLANPFREARRRGTVGWPAPSTLMRVLNPDTGDDASPGERGELLIKGPQVFAGYWNNPDATARALLPGGWLRTGDIVTVDSDGFVTLVDRAKELIRFKGFSVSPSEVEEVVRQCPGVAEVVVVGVPNDLGEEVVCAAVQLEPGAGVSETELDAYCRKHLAGYKTPKRFLLVESLPFTGLGKIPRKAVAELFDKES